MPSQFAAIYFVPHLAVSSRLLFVCGLVAIAVVTGWYWSRLGSVTLGTRVALTSLRFLSLLIVVLIFSDLSLNYQKTNPLRVLLVSTEGLPPERERAETEARLRVISALARHNVTAVDTQKNDSDMTAGDPAAAILVTDGGMDSGEAQVIVDRLRVASGGGAVYALTDLSSNSQSRISLEQVTISAPVYRGVPTTLIATVHARGMAGRESLVTAVDTAQVRSSAKVAWVSDDETRAVDIQVTPKAAGWIDYNVSVEPSVAGAIASEQKVSTLAEERQWRVLMFEGEPTSESSFIRRSLEQSGLFNVDYFAQVSRDAATGNRSTTAPDNVPDATKSDSDPTGNKTKGATDLAGSPSARLHAALANPEKLNGYDCILVGPTPNAMLSAAETGRLQSWVDRRGGGLMVLGGNNFSGSIIAPNGRLAGMMPAAIQGESFASPNSAQGLGRPVDAENFATFAMVPTAVGAESALRGFAAALAAGKDRRDVLESALQLGALRVNGLTLAVAGDAQTKTSEQGRPLIAASQFGAGRVVLFAPADSFKLKVTEATDIPAGTGRFDALWRGLILWSAAGAASGSELALSEDSPQVGGEIVVEARFRDTQFQPIAISKINASWQALAPDLSGPIGSARNLQLLPDPEYEGIWRAKFVAPEEGKYSITAVAILINGSRQNLNKSFTVVPALAAEPGAARDTLERLIRATGGQVFGEAESDKLATKLAATPRETTAITESWRLRNFWPLAFLLPLLLAGEWLILRLRL